MSSEVKKTGFMKKSNSRKKEPRGGTEGVLVAGGLLQVFGLGILIRGDSGVGKSETALELISRGHHFISDDVTLITKTEAGKIIGAAADLSRFFMEVRGLGIINIKEIFGTQAISHRTEINLVVQLKKWQEGKAYDRLGLKFYEEFRIQGTDIPQISIPVAPGRNMATLIEVASKVHILKADGYHAPRDLTKKLAKALGVDQSELE